MTNTIYLELQEIKANAEAILFSISQLEGFIKGSEAATGDSESRSTQESCP